MKPALTLTISIVIEAALCLIFIEFGSVSFVRSEDNNFIGSMICFLHVPGLYLSWLFGAFFTRPGLIFAAVVGVGQWFFLLITVDGLWKEFRRRARRRFSR